LAYSFGFILYYCCVKTKTVNRKELILEMQKHPDKPWDIIVIGGGATGLGVALDATTRGYKTLLLEQNDFAKGTSSRSTKLIHGGVRYLAQGDIFLVHEALKERGIILRNAPHLSRNQEFIVPVYYWTDLIMYGVGLKFYDFLAGRLSLGRSKIIGRKKALEILPLLNQQGLKGGVMYHDGQFDDARMAVSMAHGCVDNGAVVLNYFKVTQLRKDNGKKISGVVAVDTVSGMEYTLNARLVINAAGVFADEITRMDKPASKPSIRPSQGVHIVLDGSFLESKSAIMIPKTDDGRVLFAIPWLGKVVVGTTDTLVDDISLEPKAMDEEIGFILRNAGKYMIRQPGRKDILSVFAGLRPLATDPDNPEATREVSRRHKITLTSSGLLSIIGGKWTFYRRMAEETIDKAIRAGILEKRPCVTKELCLASDFAQYGSRRFSLYGNKSGDIEKMILENPEAGKLLHPGFPYTKGEIIWICQNEMPVTLEDVLARRIRMLFLDAKASIAMAPVVAEIMSEELGWDKDHTENQLSAYRQLALNYLC
jgi:glycerol-3-phosphate dehydrogenase